MSIRRRRCSLHLTAVLVRPAAAQGYPQKNVQYIIPFVPGGESDVMARWQQTVFRNKYKHELIVVNKPGAGGGLAWSQLNGMSADGYTIMGCNLPHIVLQPLEGTVQYKTADITPVYWFHYTADAILVAADSPYKTFADLVKAGKAKPGALTFGGSATFSANHLAHEKFNLYTGVKSTYVPFKGTGELVHGGDRQAHHRRDVLRAGRAAAERPDENAGGRARQAPPGVPRRADVQGAGLQVGGRRLSRRGGAQVDAGRGAARRSPT